MYNGQPSERQTPDYEAVTFKIWLHASSARITLFYNYENIISVPKYHQFDLDHLIYLRPKFD